MTNDEMLEQYLETGDESLLAEVDAQTAGDARAMRALLADPAAWDEPSADLPDRIAAEVRRTPQAGETITSLDAVRRRRAINPFVTAVVGLAAGLALALGVAAVLGNRDGPETTVALATTELASGARGTAEIRETPSGFEFTLNIHALPRAPAGSFYQAWVKGDRGLVAIGTFHTGGKVVLWSGVNPADYPQLTVTLEPEDGNPASSGRLLFTAALRRR